MPSAAACAASSPASDQVGDEAGQRDPDDRLAVAGAGDGGQPVVGVGAGPDDGRVAHASGALQEGAPGGGRGGDVAGLVAGDGADGAATHRNRLHAPGRLEAGALLRDDEPLVRPGGDAGLAGETRCPFADEQQVARPLEHGAGQQDGVLHVLDAGDGPGRQGGAVHQRRIELDVATGGEGGPGPGIEGRVVLEEGGGEHHRVEGASSAAKDLPRRRRRAPHPFLARCVRPEPRRPRVVEGAGAAVDGDGRQGRVAHGGRSLTGPCLGARRFSP